MRGLSVQIVEFAREHGRVTIGEAIKLTGPMLRKHWIGDERRTLRGRRVAQERVRQPAIGRGGAPV